MSPRRPGSDEGSGRPFEPRRGGRPGGPRPGGGRPSGQRPTGGRPTGGRPTGSRPAGARPFGARPSGARPTGGRPSGSGFGGPAAGSGRRGAGFGGCGHEPRPGGAGPGGPFAGKRGQGRPPFGSRPRPPWPDGPVAPAEDVTDRWPTHEGSPDAASPDPGSPDAGSPGAADRIVRPRPRFEGPRSFSSSDRPRKPTGPPRGGPRQDRGWAPRPVGRPRPPFDPRAGTGGFGDRQRIHAPAAAPAEPLAAGEELVAGRRPVEEAFAAGRSTLRLLVTPQRRQALEKIVLHATTLRIPIVEVEGGSLTALAGFDGHQGVALVVDARRFASLEEILARAIERAEPPFVLALDSLEDPQNVGTLLRSAEAAGVHGVVFPTERQAPLSPAAIKASAGATEHLLLAPLDDLPGALADLHVRGLRIVGGEEGAALTTRQADLRGPVAIVVGSEGHGLQPAVRRRCDLFVRIPMKGAIGSLNAAVAGSILLFEVAGQRDAGEAAGGD